MTTKVQSRDRRGRRVALVAPAGATLALLSAAPPAHAYSEYQIWIQKSSGRGVSCAMCHASPDGPEGVKAGQIGSLDATAMARLDRARTAFEPGAAVDSPILNDFGNHVIETVGKKRFVAMKDKPELLPPLLDKSDLDGDGITDGQEVRDGTHPLDPGHGDPWRLLRINLVRWRLHLGLLALATALGLYGIRHLLQWFGIELRRALAEAPGREGGSAARGAGGRTPSAEVSAARSKSGPAVAGGGGS